MRKALIIIFTISLSHLSFSQKDNNNTLPNHKSLMFEVNINPFSNNELLKIDNLQTKYWISDKISLRLGIMFDYKNNSISDDDYESSEIYRATTSENSLLLGLKPGIEFRFFKKTRVSPYFGIELSYINKSSKSEYVDYQEYYNNVTSSYQHYRVDTKVEGAWKGTSTLVGGWGTPYYSTNYNNEISFYSYGLNLLLGTDFFISKNFYLGFELGFGYEFKKYQNTNVEINNQNSEIANSKLKYPSQQNANLKIFSDNILRLGICF